MGNLLGDIGRSNLGQASQNIFKDVLAYKESENRTSLGLLTQQVREKEMAMRQAGEARAQADFTEKNKKAKQEFPVSMFWGPEESWPDYRKGAGSEAEKMGFARRVGGVLVTNRENTQMFMKSADPEKTYEWAIQKFGDDSAKLEAERRKLEKKPGDKDLTAKVETLYESWLTQKTSLEAQSNALAAKKKAEGGDKEALAERRVDQGDRRLDISEDNARRAERAAELRADRSDKKQGDILKQQKTTNERNMRKDFEALPEVKNYTDVVIKAGQMEEAIKESKTKGVKSMVAVDQALITMFNKMMDPTSVVRESEYARTSTDIAYLNSIQGKAQKILSGGAGLTTVEREALYNMSQRFFSASKRSYSKRATEYKALSSQYGLDPNNVVFRTQESSESDVNDILKKIEAGEL